MRAWENYLHVLESELGADIVNKWLRPLAIIKFDACNLYLEAKDPFHAMWFHEHIGERIKTQLLNNNGRRIHVHLSVAGKDAPAKKPRRRRKVESKETSEPPFTLSFDDLDPNCTLEHLVVSPSNELAMRVLCEAVGYEEGDFDRNKVALGSFNPIYLYGGAGGGKTHLMMAAAHGLKKMGYQVLYCRAETFTEHVVSAIRSAQMSTFRQAYRNVDVLLIDDVHVFARKGGTQEELFHTFNTLHTAGKQIILTANCAPGELQHIEPRLVSRFEWGISVPVDTYSKEVVAQILHAKAEALRFTLSDKVAKFLLDTFSSIQGLMRALEALILRSHIGLSDTGRKKTAVTEIAAKKLLEDLIEEENKVAVTPQSIVSAVAKFYGIPNEDIMGKSQSRECSVPRQIAMHLCREKLQMPYTRIGHFFVRDHSTVMSSCRQVKKLLDKDTGELQGTLNAICNTL